MVRYGEAFRNREYIEVPLMPLSNLHWFIFFFVLHLTLTEGRVWYPWPPSCGPCGRAATMR